MTHAISTIRLIPPDGVYWECTHGKSGWCPRMIAVKVLAGHLDEECPPPPICYRTPMGIRVHGPGCQCNDT